MQGGESSLAGHDFNQKYETELERKKQTHEHTFCMFRETKIQSVFWCTLQSTVIPHVKKRNKERCASLAEVIKYFKTTHSTDPQPLAYNTQACSLITLSISSRGTMTSSLSAAYTLFIRRLIKTKPSLPSFHQTSSEYTPESLLFEAITGNAG